MIGVVGGWRQIADINPEIECPAGFMQFSLSRGVACSSQLGPGCFLSLPFPVNGIEYMQSSVWTIGNVGNCLKRKKMD